MSMSRCDGPCVLCGKPTDSLAGDPNLWEVSLPVEPGKSGHYHIGCVTERIRKFSTLRTAGDEMAQIVFYYAGEKGKAALAKWQEARK